MGRAVPGGCAVLGALNVRDNVSAPLREHTRLPRRQVEALAELKLALSGLGACEGRRDEAGGTLRRHAQAGQPGARPGARSLSCCFLDEPTAGLDPIGAQAFDQLIGDLSSALGLTVFLITHDLDSLYALCDRVAVIADHKIVAASPRCGAGTLRAPVDQGLLPRAAGAGGACRARDAGAA